MIIEGNPEVLENPVLLNSDPYNAWVARVEATDGADKALESFVTGDEAHKGYCARAQRDDIHCQRTLR